MNGFKCISVSLLIIFAVSPMVYSQELSLDDYLDRLKQTHPLFEKENLNSQIEEQARQSLRGTRDWNISSLATYSHSEMDNSNSLLINGGLQRLFWKTGGVFNASYTFNRFDRDDALIFGLPDSYYQNRFMFSYSHPLLQNRNGFLNRLFYRRKAFEDEIFNKTVLPKF